MSQDSIKPGIETSEHKQTAWAGYLSIAAMICGMITVYLPQLIETLPGDSQAMTIAGVILTVAGLVGKVLTAMGYNAGRVRIKEAAELTEIEQVKADAIAGHGVMRDNVGKLAAGLGRLAAEVDGMKTAAGPVPSDASTERVARPVVKPQNASGSNSAAG